MMAAFAAVLVLLSVAAASLGATGNPIAGENAKPGSADWQRAPARGAIDGYASETSVIGGQTVHLHVSVRPAAPYQVRIYRLGWYHGLGARLLGCQPSCKTFKSGKPSAIPHPDPATGLIRAGWPVTDVVKTQRSWVSGYYIAELVLGSGARKNLAATVPFVITAPSSKSPILVEASVNTWQAYNSWGGKSLYPFNSIGAVPAVKASFDRPYNIPSDQNLFSWEYQFVRFLERGGFNATYTTDVDTDRNPSQLLAHKLVITNGHSEYWTKAMRDGFEAARDAGVNLVFLGADTSYWQNRYEDQSRTIVEYRSALKDPSTDPSTKTILFRDLHPARPECTLTGQQYQGGLALTGDAPRDYAVVGASLSQPWFKGTGFTPGAKLRDVVGYEWDGPAPGCAIPGTPVTYFSYPGRQGDPVSPLSLASASALAYTAPSGATVFSTGTMQFTWALDDWGHKGHADKRLQRFATNMLNDLAG